MRKIFAGILILTIVFGSIGIANAFGGPGGNMGYNQQEVNPLNLTEEQENKFEDIQENFWENREEKVEELLETNDDLRELYFENGEKEEIEKLKEKINIIQTELNQLRFNFWDEVRSILTDEQLEELEDSYSGIGYNKHGFSGHRRRGYCY